MPSKGVSFVQSYQVGVHLLIQYDVEHHDFNIRCVSVCQAIAATYGASKVTYSEEAEKKIALYTSSGFDKLPICMAKTQYRCSSQLLIFATFQSTGAHPHDILPNPILR